MAILYNLVRVYTTTVGTGQLTLGSAVPGHLTFSEGGVQNGDVISYSIIDGYNVEVGRGTYNAVLNVLSRDTVLNSTNSGAKISLGGRISFPGSCNNNTHAGRFPWHPHFRRDILPVAVI